MTDSTDSTDVAPYESGDLGNIGLEDVTSADITIPRIRVVMVDGVFSNNLTNETYEKLECVLLGLVKQRIFWHEEVEANDLPMCKSPDFAHGFPNTSDRVKPEKRFPWDRSNFNESQAKPLDIPPGVDPAYPEGYSSNGFPTLACNSCIFKDWDKGDWRTPPCNEQHTYPLLYKTPSGDYLPALFTTQRSGIKTSRAYINSFAQTNTPMFTVFTELTLKMESRGTVRYSVPIFTRAGVTDRNEWRSYADRYRTIRKFIQSAPRMRETEEAESSPNVNEAPKTDTAPAASASAATTSTPDDDLPF